MFNVIKFRYISYKKSSSKKNVGLQSLIDFDVC